MVVRLVVVALVVVFVVSGILDGNVHGFNHGFKGLVVVRGRVVVVGIVHFCIEARKYIFKYFSH